MRRALRGESGTVVGLDYRGVEVLAAYEWLPELGWGVVAKIDIAEVRQPLVRAGLMVSGIALFAIAIGVGFIIRLTSPLIQRIEARTEELGDAHERLRSHSAQVSLEVEQARRRLAVDLHDGIGQLLALMNIKLGLLRNERKPKRLGPQTPGDREPRRRGARAVEGADLAALPAHPLRGGSDRGAPMARQGHGAALRAAGDGGGRGRVRRVDEATRISLFRSVNELLVNVAKHAKTDRASVRVSSWAGTS